MMHHVYKQTKRHLYIDKDKNQKKINYTFKNENSTFDIYGPVSRTSVMLSLKYGAIFLHFLSWLSGSLAQWQFVHRTAPVNILYVEPSRGDLPTSSTPVNYSWYQIQQPWQDARPSFLVTYWDGIPTQRVSPIPVLTDSMWSNFVDPANYCAKPPTK